MADDEEEFLFPDNVPEEIQEKIKDQHRRERMARDADAHQMLSFITGLSNDDTRALRALLRAAAQDATVAAYYDGVLSVILANKEEKCWACGKDHDADLSEIMVAHGGEAPDPAPHTRVTIVRAEALSEDGTTVEPFNAEELEAHAAVLNVKFIGPVGPNCPVECLGCGVKSLSFRDRALRTDCDNCTQKAKWG